MCDIEIKKRCFNDASKCEFKWQFKKFYYSSYRYSNVHNFYKELCGKYGLKDKKNIKWDKNTCITESLKYSTMKELREKSGGLYNKIKELGLLNEIKKRKISNRQPLSFYTKDYCKSIALKYKNKTEFKKKEPNVCIKAIKQGFWDEICSHMKVRGSYTKRMIYCYEFSDNYVYVGLTYSFTERNKRHLCLDEKKHKLTPVGRHILKTNLIPKHKKLTDFLDVDIARKQEIYYIKKYKNEGWNLLNKSKGGEVGCKFKYTIDHCKKEALKYEYKKDFRSNSLNYYSASIRHKWIDEVCSHMKEIRIVWTKEMCFEEAKKFDSVQEFKNSPAYCACERKGIFDEATKHMKRLRQPNNTLNYEYCKNISLNYKTRRELFLNNQSVYLKCKKNDWLLEFYPNNDFKPNGYWDKKTCLLETKKFDNKSDFRKNSKTCYTICVRNKWLDEFFPKQIIEKELNKQI
jgi:hypothetical protein